MVKKHQIIMFSAQNRIRGPYVVVDVGKPDGRLRFNPQSPAERQGAEEGAVPGQVRRAQRRVQQPADVLPVVLGAKSNQSNQINHYKMQTNRLARIQRGSAALLVSPVIHAPRRR